MRRISAYCNRWARLAAVLTLSLALAGCIFSPRVPEPPDSNSAVDYLDQISPENVWANLGKSFQANDSGGWERNIGEAFEYIPDSDAESQYPGVFEGWFRDQEVDFIRKFYSFGPINTDVVMQNPEFNAPPPSGTEVEWIGVIYDVTVTSGSSLTRYRGAADVVFSQEGTEWFVTRWTDRQGEGDPDNPGSVLPTFGILRGTTASN